ncbi:MAG: hypothetical protein Q9P90_13990 [candidate division KSB1 bacterium]|nr:hypothetical protein [candidate division KSB1 bacterium]
MSFVPWPKLLPQRPEVRPLPTTPAAPIYLWQAPRSAQDRGRDSRRPGHGIRKHHVFWQPAVLQGRKPTLLLLSSGLSLLRLTERTFLALLFQLPPRLTRLAPDQPLPQKI